MKVKLVKRVCLWTGRYSNVGVVGVGFITINLQLVNVIKLN